MKLIHTADWHLGKLLCGVYLHEDQAYVLEEFFKALAEEKPQVILLAGDIYDRSYPPVEAVGLLNRTLEKILLELNIKMIVISGNHDHTERLDFGSSLMEKSGLYLRAKIDSTITPVTLEDEYGIYEVYPIPYAEVAAIRSLYQDSTIKTAADAMARIIQPIAEKIRQEKAEAIRAGKEPKRYIAMAHSFFMAGMEESLPEESDSERPLSIGGVDYIPAEMFAEFDYVALGHLHKPQIIGRETMRYSGSLLKYSFSEANHQKSFVILDWAEELKLRMLSLQPKRDLRIIKGSLEEILEKGRKDNASDDYIMARLTDREILIDPMSDLKSVYPNALALEYEQSGSVENVLSGGAGKDFAKKDIITLFEEFYESTTGEKVEAEKLRQRAESGILNEAD